MKSLQDYIDRYSDVANNLGYSGDSVDILIQLLAHASYISEVENISYVQEASLDKATLINSKIQHCVDNMYSVFRGTCPRVMMKIKPSKYITLNPYDLMVTSNNFNIYYLGYYKVTALGEKESAARSTTSITSTTSAIGTSKIIDTTDVSIDESGENQGTNAGPSIEGLSIDELLKYGYTGSWEYSSATFYPAVDDSDIQILIGFLAPKRIGEKLTVDKIINSNNTYYIDCTANNLSDDMYVEIVQSNGSRERLARTRVFAEHILEHKIFDLTLPSFGSRLFFANYYKDTIGRDSRSIVGMTENTNIHAQFYGYSELGDYNEPELKRVQYKGAELVKFSSEFLKENTVTETSDGLCYIEAIPRDGLNTIHYKASRDRYVSSIIRSNRDIGTVLEESFPDIIISGGTSYLFTATGSEKRLGTVDIYYIPKNEGVLLSQGDIDRFKTEKRAYYVITSTISILPGTKYFANFNIDLDLYKHTSDDDWEKTIGEDILVSGYEKKFNIDFNDSTIREIEALINKLSNVKKISGLTISFTDASGRPVSMEGKDLNQIYFEIKYSITTSITAKN